MTNAIVVTIGTGILTGLLFYLNKAANGEPFRVEKLMRTAIVSTAIAVAAYLSGWKLTADNYQVFIMANSGVIMLAERVTVLLWRMFGATRPVKYAILVSAALFFTGGISYALPTQPRAGLTWDAPTTNVDGSPYTDRGGFYVYWATVSGDFTDARRFVITDPGDTNVLFAELTGLSDPVNIYFTVTAYDASGNESDYSDEVQNVPFVAPAAVSGLRVE